MFLKGQEFAKFFSFNFFLMYFSSNTIKALKYLFKLIISWDHSAAFFLSSLQNSRKKNKSLVCHYHQFPIQRHSSQPKPTANYLVAVLNYKVQRVWSKILLFKKLPQSQKLFEIVAHLMLLTLAERMNRYPTCSLLWK